ncbi:MAG: SHOCT domain-containing protein [bacterium]|nr:SHOCT domain-containing protein [bacterium]
MMGNFGAFAWFGWIFMVFSWLLILLGIAAIIKWLIYQTKGENKKNSALDIIKERYAKGEISKEEFGEKRKELI